MQGFSGVLIGKNAGDSNLVNMEVMHWILIILPVLKHASSVKSVDEVWKCSAFCGARH
jgi:hypothetical protein